MMRLGVSLFSVASLLCVGNCIDRLLAKDRTVSQAEHSYKLPTTSTVTKGMAFSLLLHLVKTLVFQISAFQLDWKSDPKLLNSPAYLRGNTDLIIGTDIM
jgi:hypothetical protein